MADSPCETELLTLILAQHKEPSLIVRWSIDTDPLVVLHAVKMS